MNHKIVFFWFRRDLRLHDNHALSIALQSGFKVIPVFIFDKNILAELHQKTDARVQFIQENISNIQRELRKTGSDIITLFDTPANAWQTLLQQYPAHAIYTNHDYEPYAIKRDLEIAELAKKSGVSFHTFKDQVIMEKFDVVKDDGLPYTVYTPYSKKWKSVFTPGMLNPFDCEKNKNAFFLFKSSDVQNLDDLGFEKSKIHFPSVKLNAEIVKHYENTRDIPGIEGTTRMSLHLRFGTVSVRELFKSGMALSEKWTNELIWREFYMQILFHFPYVVYGAFKPQYDLIQWRNHEAEFKAWCEGKTGYPIVDAGMRELNQTGYMHNRVRMIVSSFLTKHLLIDWRWGEAYFAEKLLDFELSSNNGGWQWAAGSGVDAAPYFRIFNPYLQTKKFDPDLKYIRKWVPEIDSLTYTPPIVDHEFARKRCLDTYAIALKG